MTFRFHRPGDEEALVRLFESVYGKPMSPEWWRWKLLGRPGDLERVVLAEEEGRPVFQVGGIPCPALLEGRPATVMVAVDAMTHPDHRGRGLLTGGYLKLLAHWRERGVDLVLGMPNEQHGLRTVARGWRPLFRLRWRVRLLLPERVLARRVGVTGLASLRAPGRLWDAWWSRGGPDALGVELDEANPSDAEVDALWGRCQGGPLRHGLVRDGAWMRWRYLDPPGRPYHLLCARRQGRLEGVLAYHFRNEDGRKVAFVAEILAPPGSEAVEEALVREIAARARAEGAELVATLVLQGAPRERVLARNGYLGSWGAFTVACVLLGEGVGVDSLRDPRGWSLEGGCFDVV